MISKSILRDLSLIVGREHLITSHDVLSEYASDGTRLEFLPDAVAFPRTSDEVSLILRLATREGFPVIPRGAGTGMSGGALPVNGGLIMAMDRFDRIVTIDQDNLICKVEPAVVTALLQKEVERVGLFYPPDPASADKSTIGGNVAECAGGLRAVKYGVTRDYVMGLTMVLPTGEVMKAGVETMKGVAGYDLVRLVVGSEGTLAVVTEITLRLVPKPDAKKTMVAFFRDISSALGAVSTIIRRRIIPSILEFMDRLCLDCVREDLGISIPREAGAMLLIEVDGYETAVREEYRMVESLCQECACVRFQSASDKDEEEKLWEARRSVSPSLYRLRPHKISEDIVVPRSRLAEMVTYLHDSGDRYGFPVPVFGHAGDGNMHVNIMLDKNDPLEMEKAGTFLKILFDKVIEVGGTITGEHGIGITKAPYLGMEISRDGLVLMKRIKEAFDPRGILNPGKIFDMGEYS